MEQMGSRAEFCFTGCDLRALLIWAKAINEVTAYYIALPLLEFLFLEVEVAKSIILAPQPLQLPAHEQCNSVICTCVDAACELRWLGDSTH